MFPRSINVESSGATEAFVEESIPLSSIRAGPSGGRTPFGLGKQRTLGIGQSLRPSNANPSNPITGVPLADFSIIPNVPESLPTTPGYELTQEQMLSTNFNTDIPTQRPRAQRNDTEYLKGSNNLNNVFSRYLILKLGRSSPLNRQSNRSRLTESNRMTFLNPPKNSWRVVSCCIWCFTIGFADGAPGALLPYIETYYSISYSIVSLIWISNAVGYIVVALLAHKIDRFDKRTALLFGCIASLTMYALVSSGWRFFLIVVGFFFGGIGLAINVSQINVFLSRLEQASAALGYFHGSYGFGAFISPLVAIQFINHGISWHMFYTILAGGMLLNLVSLFGAFTNASIDLAPWEEVVDHVELVALSSESVMRLALQNRLTWLLSFFVLLYQGVEVSLGGWIVTYILENKQGKALSAGYVASGYWFGLTLGRILLTRPMHKWLGARRAIIILACATIALLVLVWVIPHAIAAGVFVSSAGVFIGPTYPLMITLAARMLPRKIQVVSLTIMTAFGSSGGALFPFLVGLISQFTGPFVLNPVCIALYTTMLIVWLCLPNVERQRVSSFWQRLW